MQRIFILKLGFTRTILRIHLFYSNKSILMYSRKELHDFWTINISVPRKMKMNENVLRFDRNENVYNMKDSRKKKIFHWNMHLNSGFVLQHLSFSSLYFLPFSTSHIHRSFSLAILLFCLIILSYSLNFSVFSNRLYTFDCIILQLWRCLLYLQVQISEVYFNFFSIYLILVHFFYAP